MVSKTVNILGFGLVILAVILGTQLSTAAADCSDRTYECILNENVLVNTQTGSSTTVSF